MGKDDKNGGIFDIEIGNNVKKGGKGDRFYLGNDANLISNMTIV